MAKVHIVGHRRRLDELLAALYELGIVHLIDVIRDDSVRLPPLTPGEERMGEIEDLRYLRARLGAVLELSPLPIPAGGAPIDLATVRAELEQAAPQIETEARHLDELEAEQESIPRHLRSLRRLLPLVPELTALEGYDTMALVLDARHAGVLGELNANLDRLLAGNFEVISAQVDADTIGAIVVFPRAARAEVEGLVGKEQVSRLRLPHEFESVPFREAITAMERRLAELPGEIETVRERIADLIRAHPEWPQAVEVLQARLDQLGALRRLGATSHTFVVSGWVPRRDIKKLEDELASRLEGDVIVHETLPDPDEQAPVLMENPAVVRPFQSLVRLLSIPRYGSLDPSRLMALFLPLFFGMMLGDIGYGVLVLALALGASRSLRAKGGLLADLSRVLVLAGGWTIVWGTIYGELFGNLGHDLLGLRPLWINREDALNPLLVFAVVVGAAHMVLGLILGVWESARHKDRQGTARRAGTLAALMGLFVLVAIATGRLPTGAVTPAVAAVIVGLVVMIVVEGPLGLLLGPLELMGAVGNVLSYLRIAAIGLASVYLARVANELGATGPLWIGLIVAVLFHALNLVLGILSPTIQSLRLHYVEFFGTFYREGGEPFQPFGGKPPPD